jgi:prophage antirepressor-like protein
MTESLTTLFEGKEIRTCEKGGEPWFVVADLAEAWGLSRNTFGKIMVRNEDVFMGFKAVLDVTYARQNSPDCQNLNEKAICVNERGLYVLLGKISIDRLKHPEVRERILRFQRWVPELVQRYRKKELVTIPAGQDIRSELEEASELAVICGRSPESFQAVILKKHGKGELAEVLQPALVHGEPGQWLNPSEIGHECGLTAQQVNYWMLNHGFQYRDGPLWRLTPKGMDHGEGYVFEATSRHSEIRIRWHRSVLIAAGLKRDLAPDQVMLPQKSQY